VRPCCVGVSSTVDSIRTVTHTHKATETTMARALFCSRKQSPSHSRQRIPTSEFRIPNAGWRGVWRAGLVRIDSTDSVRGPVRTHARCFITPLSNPFQSNPFHSIPIHSNPFHSNLFHSNPFQSIPFQSNPFHSNPFHSSVGRTLNHSITQ